VSFAGLRKRLIVEHTAADATHERVGQAKPGASIMAKLRALWSGELPLGEAFWTFAVGIGLLVNLSTSALFLALIAADRPWAALFVGYVLSVPYNIVALVGVWRSAARYQGKAGVADLARIVALVGMLVLSVT
jgi:hypothetical protein